MTRSLAAAVAFTVTLTLAAPLRAAEPVALGSLFALAPAAEPAHLGGAVPMFNAGAWTVQSYISGTIGDADHGDIYTAHLGVGYFIKDDLSFNVDVLGGVVDAGPVSGDDNGIVGGFDLLFRWHFLRGEKWSFYADGGCGFQLADTNFPSDSHHNFRPQLGVGLTYALREDVNLMAGARWLHISNAHTTSGNDGLDAAMFYAGLMWGF